MVRRDNVSQTAMANPAQLPIMTFFVALFPAIWNPELRRLTMRAVVAAVAASLAVAALYVVPANAAPPAGSPPPSSPAAPAKLSPSDIQATFFNGQPFTASTPSSLKFKMTFTADGKMKRQPSAPAARARAPGSSRRTASAPPGRAPKITASRWSRPATISGRYSRARPSWRRGANSQRIPSSPSCPV